MGAPPWLIRLRAALGRRRDLRYWKRRAVRHGARAVFHLGHDAEEVEAVTRRQRELLLPLLESELSGRERVVLDFGCGPGRFTADLARLVGGSAIGVDPIRELLAIAPAAPGTEYRQVVGGRIPLPSGSVDAVWSCIVFSSITDMGAVREAVAEIARVLRPGGLIFLVENTAERTGNPHLRYRSIAEYQALFASARAAKAASRADRPGSKA